MEQTWIFDSLAVTLECVDFLDPALAGEPDVRERGVRLEIRPVETTVVGSIYSSRVKHLGPGVCRIDLLESASNARDRMHWHPTMSDGEPCDRTFEPDMVDDPLGWLRDRLAHVEELLAQSGLAVDAQATTDVEAIRGVVPDIVAAAGRGLDRARVDPWPDVVRDERGLALNP